MTSNYGCFFLRAGRWVLQLTGTKATCEAERDYLRDMLGLRTAIFQRVKT